MKKLLLKLIVTIRCSNPITDCPSMPIISQGEISDLGDKAGVGVLN